MVNFVIKLLRAYGECLGAKRRWVNFVIKLLRAYGECLGAKRR